MRYHPWATEVDGTIWRVRINDFPDELMYSLISETKTPGAFHDWPETCSARAMPNENQTIFQWL
jgi:hypothetical protein